MVMEFRMNSPNCESPEQDWVITKVREKSLRSNAMFSIVCEMVICEDGSKGLARVCVVDRNLKVKLDELVKPNKEVADYKAEIKGVTSEDLKEITCSLSDIQIG